MEKRKKLWTNEGYFHYCLRDAQVDLFAVMESYKRFLWKLEGEENPNVLVKDVDTEGLD